MAKFIPGGLGIGNADEVNFWRQAGNTLYRNPSQLQGIRLAKQVAPRIPSTPSSGVLNQLGKMGKLYNKLAPKFIGAKLGFDASNALLERMGISNWAHPHLVE